MDNEQKKIEYLKIIQEIIARMSTISTIIKGFTVTLAVAFSVAIIDNKINDNLYYIAAAVPFLSLIWLDSYYLGLERKYRAFYELVRIEKKEADFKLKLDKGLIDKKKAKADIWSCMSSVCIYGFYFPLIIMFFLFLIRLYYNNLYKGMFYNIFF